MKELLQIVARDADRRTVLVGAEPGERRAAPELGLSMLNGTASGMPPALSIGTDEPARCVQTRTPDILRAGWSLPTVVARARRR